MKKLLFMLALLQAALVTPLHADNAAASDGKVYKFQGLAKTPPMGWNSWNTFACNIDEKLIRDMADVMVSSGMRDAGYVYVNIDDCWHGERDANGAIQANAQRFPSGMKALADFVHSKGLKLGIYSDAGEKTCGGHPGSQGHEYQDALSYANWGIDYLKYDWCNTDDRTPAEAYRTMAKALQAAGHPIVFSICEWGDNKPWLWASPLGHSWRTTGDVIGCWDCVVSHGSWNSNGVMRILDKQEGLRQYAGPDHWNDADMLEVGNMAAVNEDRAHFAMWAMLASPLIAGNDLRSMTSATRGILTNTEVIAIDQDALGIQGFPYKKEDGLEVWAKPLAGGAWAVTFLNRNHEPRKVKFDWRKENIDDALNKLTTAFDKKTYRLHDLLSHSDSGLTDASLEIVVAGHDVAMYRLEPK